MDEEAQEQAAPESGEQSSSEFSSEFVTAQTPDQSNVPHHPAADPTAPSPEPVTADQS